MKIETPHFKMRFLHSTSLTVTLARQAMDQDAIRIRACEKRKTIDRSLSEFAPATDTLHDSVVDRLRAVHAAVTMNPARFLPGQAPFCLSILGAMAIGITGCSTTQPQQESAATADANPGSFASVRPVLETNCVHCHGPQHLTTMPPFETTKQLAALIGPGNWIVPGQPEASRFFHVVVFPDQVPGAMPPTGHAISGADVQTLRAWIKAGAPVPAGRTIRLSAKGELPRSR